MIPDTRRWTRRGTWGRLGTLEDDWSLTQGDEVREEAVMVMVMVAMVMVAVSAICEGGYRLLISVLIDYLGR